MIVITIGFVSVIAFGQTATIKDDSPINRLHFTGEKPLAEFRFGDDQNLTIVRSCAPLPEGCKKPVIKARSIKHIFGRQVLWEFSDLHDCSGVIQAWEHLLEANADDFGAAEELRETIDPCLTPSHMTPPWERDGSE